MKRSIIICTMIVLSFTGASAQDLNKLWTEPSGDSKSWVIWYWMNSAVTREGITADLEAMKEAGIGGAYLMSIRGATEPPYLEPVAEQLSPLWWEMVSHAFHEADRLGLEIGFHVCDGFALAGGPWITPELSMQKVVWSKTTIEGNTLYNDILPQPESYPGYYRDIALFAYPALEGEGISTETQKPVVTTNLPDIDPAFLADANSDQTFRCNDSCWIQYTFEEAFTCRSLQITPSGRNLQSQRFTIQASEDGKRFRTICQLEPPRQGWQNDDFPMTHATPPTTAPYFRFLYNIEGTEPGSEDLDAGKWKQSLKIKNILLSSESKVHQYEGKNGLAWRVSPRTTGTQVPTSDCIDPKQMIDLSGQLDASGRLRWKAPAGRWTLLRLGHTSTGHTNATGGKGSGLECDKFNPEAVRLQFNSWFGQAYELAGEEMASRMLKVFHIDSWECGSQNWTTRFPEEFKQRREYDLHPFLPLMAGIPVQSATVSEQVLYDIRQTIAELVVDVFFATLQEEAQAKGCRFSAENVAPTMLSDGMLHFKQVDMPMGEYWLQSPTHDKPNDVLDAVSGGHIYNKNIIKAEAFTQLRCMFDEYPEMLKTMQDRHYALGINRIDYHVFAQNPWLDRQPGMTLDGIGLYFQRDQTWWKPGKAWVDYAQRCQALLQVGKPVADIAVFTGEELPRRSILPDRLVPFLPGIFGEERVESERIRLANEGQPTRQMPVGVNHSTGISNAEDWVNALRGYQYDSMNPDALLQAWVEDGEIVLPGNVRYKVLVVPGKHRMQPNPELMSAAVVKKLYELADQGATVMISELPGDVLSYQDDRKTVQQLASLREYFENDRQSHWSIGEGRVIRLPYQGATFSSLGFDRDFYVTEDEREYAPNIAYTHRQDAETDIYFISNQEERTRHIFVSLRATGRVPEIWNPVTGERNEAKHWEIQEGRTFLPLQLHAGESLFIVMRQPSEQTRHYSGMNWLNLIPMQTLTTPWQVQFEKAARGPEESIEFKTLSPWNEHSDPRIRYYAGTASYTNHFQLNRVPRWDERFFLELDSLYNLAEVKVNGQACGTIWTKPYRVDITEAVKKGDNTLKIEVTNTWANRILGDEDFGNAPEDPSQAIWTNARYRKAKKELVPSGLTGNVRISLSTIPK